MSSLHMRQISRDEVCNVGSWLREKRRTVHNFSIDMEENECTISEASDDFSTSETLLGDKDNHIDQIACIESKYESDSDGDNDVRIGTKKLFPSSHPCNRLRLVEGRVQVVGFAANVTTVPKDPRIRRKAFWDQVMYYVLR
jgi:hypothetical protein